LFARLRQPHACFLYPATRDWILVTIERHCLQCHASGVKIAQNLEIQTKKNIVQQITAAPVSEIKKIKNPFFQHTFFKI